MKRNGVEEAMLRQPSSTISQGPKYIFFFFFVLFLTTPGFFFVKKYFIQKAFKIFLFDHCLFPQLLAFTSKRISKIHISQIFCFYFYL